MTERDAIPHGIKTGYDTVPVAFASIQYWGGRKHLEECWWEVFWCKDFEQRALKDLDQVGPNRN